MRSIGPGFCGVIAIRRSYSCRAATARKAFFLFLSLVFQRGMEARASSIYIYTHTSHGWAGFLFELQEARERTNGVLFHRTGRRSYFFFYSIWVLFFFPHSPTMLVYRSYTQCVCLVWAPQPLLLSVATRTALLGTDGTVPLLLFFFFYIASETSDCLFSLSLVHSLFVLFWEKFFDLPITHDRCWDS